jgi:hypothetical protein
MNGLRSRRPSTALVISIIALFVALGGTGYAALKLPKDSVGSRQLKANAVNSSKVKNGSLLQGDFKAGQLPAGAQGLQGPQGPKGDRGSDGANGETGSQGPPGPLLDTLPSGKTEKGVYLVYGFKFNGGTPVPADVQLGTAINFPIPLASAPEARYVQAGSTAVGGCAGGTVAKPVAAPGYLCVFEGEKHGRIESGWDICNLEMTVCGQGPGRFGAGVLIRSSGAATGVAISGSWAVTAP